jgi:AcrR family transcriptional regulator
MTELIKNSHNAKERCNVPRALTEKEKSAQCDRLLDKGKEAVISYGMRRVSVDDITKAAGIAKGTFYQHFETKEHYLLALIERLHRSVFEKAKLMIFPVTGGGLQANVRIFLRELFNLPELVFFIKNETEITLLVESFHEGELQTFKQMEKGLFEGILRMAGIDTSAVKPGVVHNFIHALFLIAGCEYMAAEDLNETSKLITECLLNYVFQTEERHEPV